MHKHSRKVKEVKPARQATKIWLGIDLGDRWSDVCAIDGTGEVRERTRVRTTPAAFREHFERRAGATVALETGTHSSWASRVLADCGLSVTVANARELRKIYQNNRKSDRQDAEILARLVRFDHKLLAPIHHRSAQMQADLSILRARDVLIGSRTKNINAVRGLVKAAGHRLVRCSADAFVRRVSQDIPLELQAAVIPLLRVVETLNEQIRVCDQQVERHCTERYPETTLLRQIKGVGPLTALGFVLTIADKARFHRSRDVGSYLGLVPRQDDSGEQRSQLGITKAGNTFMRRLLVNAAQYILGPFGPDCNLRRYGERLAARGGKNAKKRAVVAVARKVAVVMHHLWVTGEVYQPFYGPAEAIAV